MRYYKQTTEFTSASAALMMIVKRFKPDFALSKEHEYEFWQRSVALPTRGSSIYGLALIAHSFGIPVKIVVGDPNYKFPMYRFRSYKLVDVEEATFGSGLMLKKAQAQGIKIEARDFDLKEVKKLLQNGKLLLLRLNAGLLRNKRAVSNYLPVFDYSDEKFLLYDPASGKKLLRWDRMQEAFDAVKTRLRRDHRMLVFG